MKELKQKIIDEELDIYDVHARPVGEEQKKLSKEVLEAMEELRKESEKLNNSGFLIETKMEIEMLKIINSLANKSQNLLNALDTQFNHKVRDKEVCLSGEDINQHNSLLDRVERLEQIIEGKNG